MTNDKQATAAAELESAKDALQAARKELDTARDRETRLLDTLKAQAGTLSEKSDGKSAMRRYAEYLILLAILAIAADLLYLMRQLHVLLT